MWVCYVFVTSPSQGNTLVGEWGANVSHWGVIVSHCPTLSGMELARDNLSLCNIYAYLYAYAGTLLARHSPCYRKFYAVCAYYCA